MVVVAHPDDEAIACGALLQRMRSPAIVFMTDGAPEDPKFWGKPYSSRAYYMDVRRSEAQNALSQIRAASEPFDVPDQNLYRNLDSAIQHLNQLIQRYRPEIILTHAYEGGHPDHDACSFLSSVIGKQFGVPVWEMPLYNRAAGEMVRQQFLTRDDSPGRAVLTATVDEIQHKKKMISAYQSQADFIKDFEPEVEQFRPQPQYDFAEPPHKGVLNYEAWNWPMSGSDLCEAFKKIRDEGPQRKREEAA